MIPAMNENILRTISRFCHDNNCIVSIGWGHSRESFTVYVIKSASGTEYLERRIIPATANAETVVVIMLNELLNDIQERIERVKK